MYPRKRFLAAAALAMFVSGSAAAYGLGQTKDEKLARPSKRAASYLLAVQLRNGGWVWEEGSGRAKENYGGIVGESLLAAFEQTGFDADARVKPVPEPTSFVLWSLAAAAGVCLHGCRRRSNKKPARKTP